VEEPSSAKGGRRGIRFLVSACSGIAGLLTACELAFPLGGYGSLPLDDAGAHDRSSVDAETSTCLRLEDDFSSADASAAKWFPLGSAQVLDGFGELTPYAYNAGGGLLWRTPVLLDEYDLRFEVAAIDVLPSHGGGGPLSTGIAFAALDTSSVSVECANHDHLCMLGGNTPGYAVALVTCFFECDYTQSHFPVLVAETEPYPDGGYVDADIGQAPAIFTAVDSVAVADAETPPEESWHSVEVQVAEGRATVSLDGATILSGAPIQGRTSFEGYWGFGAGTSNRTRNLVRNVVMGLGAGCSADP
jgi:hypothetical protein